MWIDHGKAWAGASRRAEAGREGDRNTKERKEMETEKKDRGKEEGKGTHTTGSPKAKGRQLGNNNKLPQQPPHTPNRNFTSSTVQNQALPRQQAKARKDWSVMGCCVATGCSRCVPLRFLKVLLAFLYTLPPPTCSKTTSTRVGMGYLHFRGQCRQRQREKGRKEAKERQTEPTK